MIALTATTSGCNCSFGRSQHRFRSIPAREQRWDPFMTPSGLIIGMILKTNDSRRRNISFDWRHSRFSRIPEDVRVGWFTLLWIWTLHYPTGIRLSGMNTGTQNDHLTGRDLRCRGRSGDGQHLEISIKVKIFQYPQSTVIQILLFDFAKFNDHLNRIPSQRVSNDIFPTVDSFQFPFSQQTETRLEW